MKINRNMSRMWPLIGTNCLSVRSIHLNDWSRQMMTSQEVATALRPFFFVVHPDRFWRHPKEKDTNEDSLKRLNAYIESHFERKQTNDTKITFYLKEIKINHKNNELNQNEVQLKQIDIKLYQTESVHKTVHRILTQSKLSTEYLESIAKKTELDSNQTNSENRNKFSGYRGSVEAFWIKRDEFKEKAFNLDDLEDMVTKKSELNLIEWLRENNVKAMTRLNASKPIRHDLNGLRDELKSDLGLKSLIWDCGWGVSHIRGCLKSLRTLKQQHINDFHVLRGKTLVFGGQTGVSLGGHIILSIEDVRHNWLAFLRKIPNYDLVLEKLPFTEGLLSGSLRGIEIDHRKFSPAVMVERYIKQLQKLTEAIVEYHKQNGFPECWPSRLDRYQLVVECEAGPLMLSPTGQFIVPASCPAFLLFDFISENMKRSELLRQMYLNNKSKEVNIIDRCLTVLGLICIEKDDNITPDLMIKCCESLLNNSDITSRFFRGLHLRVSHYYSVSLDGEVCIPWNFTIN